MSVMGEIREGSEGGGGRLLMMKPRGLGMQEWFKND